MRTHSGFVARNGGGFEVRAAGEFVVRINGEFGANTQSGHDSYVPDRTKLRALLSLT